MRDVAYDDGFWVDAPSFGTVSFLSSDKPADPPVLLVPDGHGDYREHVVQPRKLRRLGF